MPSKSYTTRCFFLAESSTKADEYACDDEGYYEGVFALLLCRVCLGKVYYTTKRNPDAGDMIKSGEYDSTCGDRSKSANTFREFVVYHKDQVYPEYVVLYSRAFASDAPLASFPDFHMQLPVYWTNCHKDPSVDSFAHKYKARAKTHELIQRLITGTSKSDLELLGVTRVEHAAMWLRYVKFKSSIQKQLSKSGDAESQGPLLSCKSADKLGGRANGNTITHLVLSDFGSENAISTDNLDHRINEHLLWHGSTAEAVSSISSEGFCIPKHKNKAHGSRFGIGAYMAEDLDKSLEYAPPDEAGICHVLLCRTTCGEFHYTEETSDTTATSEARETGKDSVLANPRGSGLREFIVLDEEQLYPEFIIKLSRRKKK